MAKLLAVNSIMIGEWRIGYNQIPYSKTAGYLRSFVSYMASYFWDQNASRKQKHS